MVFIIGNSLVPGPHAPLRLTWCKLPLTNVVYIFVRILGGGIGTSYIKPSRIFALTGAATIFKTEMLENKASNMKNVSLDDLGIFPEV